MSPELFEHCIAQAKPLVDQVYLHILGEPLLHPKLHQILELCTQHDVPVAMTSNGVLIQRHTDLLLQSPKLRQINFSLQALREGPLNQRPAEALDQILEFCQKANLKRPELYINLRLWNLQSEDPETSEWNAWAQDSIEKRLGTKITLDPKIQARKSQNIGGRIYIQFDSRFNWPSQSDITPRKQGTCHGLRSHFGILVDGTVVPCCLDEKAVLGLGNVKEQSLDQCLQSERAHSMRDGFLRFELVEDYCQKCPYSQRFKPKSALQRPQNS